MNWFSVFNGFLWIRIRIIWYGSGSSPTFDTDPDPGKLYGFYGSGSATLALGSGSVLQLRDQLRSVTCMGTVCSYLPYHVACSCCDASGRWINKQIYFYQQCYWNWVILVLCLCQPFYIRNYLCFISALLYKIRRNVAGAGNICVLSNY